MNYTEILNYNKNFVKEKLYIPYASTKYPNKKLAILSCMDTRMTELLPAAMNIKNGDVKIIKNAGAMVNHPFGSVMRSILVAIYELDVEEIIVVGHFDCGVQNLDSEKIISKMLSKGITNEQINLIRYCGVDFEKWLHGFDSVEESVGETIEFIKNHPLIPKDIKVFGLIMDPRTGELFEI